MQYETIILELMTRIKKLEEDVATLKARVESNAAFVESQTEAEAMGEGTETALRYQKITEAMMKICYQLAKRMQGGEKPQLLANEISRKTGMNVNTALMYLHAVCGMLNGEKYKRAISAKSTKVYFDWIWDEYGKTGLKKAICATKLHIRYRKEDCGQTVTALEKLCREYEGKL